LGFFSVHTILDVRRGLTIPACLGERRNKTGSGLLASVATASRHHRTVAIGPPSKGSFIRLKEKELMGNIPGLSGEAVGTEDAAGVTHGIGWEMFNSTDEDMEVLINVPTDSYLPQGGTILCW
jgi:hypothetical protein